MWHDFPKQEERRWKASLQTGRNRKAGCKLRWFPGVPGLATPETPEIRNGRVCPHTRWRTVDWDRKEESNDDTHGRDQSAEVLNKGRAE